MAQSRRVFDLLNHGDTQLATTLKNHSKIKLKLLKMRELDSTLNEVCPHCINGDRRDDIRENLERENRRILDLQEENAALQTSIEKSFDSLRNIAESYKLIKETLTGYESMAGMEEIEATMAKPIETNEESIRIHVKEMTNMISKTFEKNLVDMQLYSQIATENKGLREAFKLCLSLSPQVLAHFHEAVEEIVNESVNESMSDDSKNSTILRKP